MLETLVSLWHSSGAIVTVHEVGVSIGGRTNMRAVLARLLIVAAPVMLAFAHRPTNGNWADDSMRERGSGLAICSARRSSMTRRCIRVVVIES